MSVGSLSKESEKKGKENVVVGLQKNKEREKRTKRRRGRCEDDANFNVKRQKEKEEVILINAVILEGKHGKFKEILNFSI